MYTIERGIRNRVILNWISIGRLWMYNTTLDSFIGNSTGYKTCKRGASIPQRNSAMRMMDKPKAPKQLALNTTEMVNTSEDKLIKDPENREYIIKGKGPKKKRHNNNNHLFFDII